MAKQKNNPIALEIRAFENKVNEFQGYLDNKNINNIPDDIARAKEIDIQIKLMNILPNLLEQLKKLKETDAVKTLEARGGMEVTGIMDDFITKKNG